MSSEIVPETPAVVTTSVAPDDSKLRRLARRAKKKLRSVPQGWGQTRSLGARGVRESDEESVVKVAEVPEVPVKEPSD